MSIELIMPSQYGLETEGAEWGWTDIIYNDQLEDVCLKRLHLRGAAGSPIQRYPDSGRVLTCEEGQLIVEALTDQDDGALLPSQLGMMIGADRVLVPAGCSIRIARNTWYRISTGVATVVVEATRYHDLAKRETAETWEEVYEREA